jgi:hypothetical protein
VAKYIGSHLVTRFQARPTAHLVGRGERCSIFEAVPRVLRREVMEVGEVQPVSLNDLIAGGLFAITFDE